MVLGLDFDGTLAPIVVDPSQARADPQTLALLQQLASRLLKLAIITGRDTDLLSNRVPIERALLIGNHGLEEWRDGASSLSAQAEPFAGGLERAIAALNKLPPARKDGVHVEAKRASVSVHFREAEDPQVIGPELERALRPLAKKERLRLNAGRYLWELRPAIEVDKGTVVTGLAASLKPDALIYVGDDVTDADAFRALRLLHGVKTLAVGVRSAEVPSETFANCDLEVDGVEGVKTFLRDLLAIG